MHPVSSTEIDSVVVLSFASHFPFDQEQLNPTITAFRRSTASYNFDGTPSTTHSVHPSTSSASRSDDTDSGRAGFDDRAVWEHDDNDHVASATHPVPSPATGRRLEPRQAAGHPAALAKSYLFVSVVQRARATVDAQQYRLAHWHQSSADTGT